MEFTKAIKGNTYDSAIKEAKKSGVLNLSGLNLNGKCEHFGIESVKEVIIESTKLSGIAFLKTYPNLERLTIYQEGIKDFSVLKSLTSLKYLDLWDETIDDISFLCGLTLDTLIISPGVITDDESEDYGTLDFSPLHQMTIKEELVVYAEHSHFLDEEGFKAKGVKKVFRDRPRSMLIEDPPLPLNEERPQMAKFPINLACHIFAHCVDQEKATESFFNEESKELREKFFEALENAYKSLKPSIMRVVKCYFEKGYSELEISKELGLGRDSLRMSLAHGLRKLRHPRQSKPLAIILDCFPPFEEYEE